MKQIKRELRKEELRLVTDDTENNRSNQPTLLHVTRFSVTKHAITGTACGKKNFTGQIWMFLDWMYESGPICEACRRSIEAKDGAMYG